MEDLPEPVLSEVISCLPSEIHVNIRFRKDKGSLAELKESIVEVGLLQPIGITKEKVLVFGERRLQSWKELYGDKPISCVITDGDTFRLKLKELHENSKRKDMKWDEICLAEEEIKQTYAKLYGWTKQGERTDLPPKPDNNTDETLPPDSKVNQKKLSAELNISRQKLSQDLQLAQGIKKHPQIKKCSSKKKALKKLREIEIQEELAKLPLPFEDDEEIRLLCGDFCYKSREVIEPHYIDVIITDPPYSKESIPLYETLSKVGQECLKEGGSLIVMTGQSYLPEIIQALSKHLTYHWILAYLTPGGQSAQLWNRKVNTFWKPLLWFTNGEYKGEWIGDVTKSDPNDNDKKFSEHGQSESGITDIVRRFVKAGQVVFDPFMGAGTTGVVARKLGCRFIGIDKDENMVKIANSRIAEANSKEIKTQ